MSKLEDEILEAMRQIETQTAELAKLEAEVKTFAAEVAALQPQIEAQAAEQKAQLDELETAIIEAEDVIPEDHREHYRRTVKQHGADALAAVENGACSGCYVSVTAQMMNELINGGQPLLLHDLRPHPLPGRGRCPQHPAHRRKAPVMHARSEVDSLSRQPIMPGYRAAIDAVPMN